MTKFKVSGYIENPSYFDAFVEAENEEEAKKMVLNEEVEFEWDEENYSLEQEIKIIEIEDESKNPYAECISCKKEEKKENMHECDAVGSNEWICNECSFKQEDLDTAQLRIKELTAKEEDIMLEDGRERDFNKKEECG